MNVSEIPALSLVTTLYPVVGRKGWRIHVSDPKYDRCWDYELFSFGTLATTGKKLGEDDQPHFRAILHVLQELGMGQPFPLDRAKELIHTAELPNGSVYWLIGMSTELPDRPKRKKKGTK